jgi:hypothetical protein
VTVKVGLTVFWYCDQCCKNINIGKQTSIIDKGKCIKCYNILIIYLISFLPKTFISSKHCFNSIVVSGWEAILSSSKTTYIKFIKVNNHIGYFFLINHFYWLFGFQYLIRLHIHKHVHSFWTVFAKSWNDVNPTQTYITIAILATFGLLTFKLVGFPIL